MWMTEIWTKTNHDNHKNSHVRLNTDPTTFPTSKSTSEYFHESNQALLCHPLVRHHWFDFNELFLACTRAFIDRLYWLSVIFEGRGDNCSLDKNCYGSRQPIYRLYIIYLLLLEFWSILRGGGGGVPLPMLLTNQKSQIFCDECRRNCLF